MGKSEAERADLMRDVIENPEEYWRKLETEIRSWPKLPPELDPDDVPTII